MTKLLQLVTNVLFMVKRNFTSSGFNRLESEIEVGESVVLRQRCSDPVINFDFDVLERDVLQDTTLSSVPTFSSDNSNARLIDQFERSGLFLLRD